jgi:hypothetical protein
MHYLKCDNVYKTHGQFFSPTHSAWPRACGLITGCQTSETIFSSEKWKSQYLTNQSHGVVQRRMNEQVLICFLCSNHSLTLLFLTAGWAPRHWPCILSIPIFQNLKNSGYSGNTFLNWGDKLIHKSKVLWLLLLIQHGCKCWNKRGKYMSFIQSNQELNVLKIHFMLKLVKREPETILILLGQCLYLGKWGGDTISWGHISANCWFSA